MQKQCFVLGDCVSGTNHQSIYVFLNTLSDIDLESMLQKSFITNVCLEFLPENNFPLQFHEGYVLTAASKELDGKIGRYNTLTGNKNLKTPLMLNGEELDSNLFKQVTNFGQFVEVIKSQKGTYSDAYKIFLNDIMPRTRYFYQYYKDAEPMAYCLKYITNPILLNAQCQVIDKLENLGIEVKGIESTESLYLTDDYHNYERTNILNDKAAEIIRNTRGNSLVIQDVRHSVNLKPKYVQRSFTDNYQVSSLKKRLEELNPPIKTTTFSLVSTQYVEKIEESAIDKNYIPSQNIKHFKYYQDLTENLEDALNTDIPTLSNESYFPNFNTSLPYLSNLNMSLPPRYSNLDPKAFTYQQVNSNNPTVNPSAPQRQTDNAGNSILPGINLPGINNNQISSSLPTYSKVINNQRANPSAPQRQTDNAEFNNAGSKQSSVVLPNINNATQKQTDPRRDTTLSIISSPPAYPQVNSNNQQIETNNASNSINSQRVILPNIKITNSSAVSGATRQQQNNFLPDIYNKKNYYKVDIDPKPSTPLNGSRESSANSTGGRRYKENDKKHLTK